MKWLRFLFLIAVLAAIGCSGSSTPKETIEEPPVDPAAEAEAAPPT